MMKICGNCQHANDEGNFCENCGAKLGEGEIPVAGGAQVQVQPNQQLETAKNASKIYFGYFLDQLKAPHAKIREVRNAHLINAFITIVLFSLFLPAMVFYGIKENIKGFVKDMDKLIGWELEDFLFTINGLVDDSLKLAVITKPVLTTLLLILVMVSLTFLGAKLSKLQASLQVIAARYGALLVPLVALCAAGIILSLLGFNVFGYIFLLSIMGAVFLIPPFILRSLDQTNKGGLDVVLTTLLIYVVSLIVLGLIGEYLFDALVAGLRSINFDDIL
ncbi:zinc ribbon domain-containing protein [Rossellomorea marisflavi]|uniref:zinc ribbon domain-containing protein n=1 Tax=Rossellomorea marisflavi TaxID=189381 RepID=UPI0027A1F1F6|nr:zinc ribbon domain-containing protein [Rossellomorea marisflavi]UTE73504.1 zinc ribbon domain-containing protein [Rossellomorea marisflavi]